MDNINAKNPQMISLRKVGKWIVSTRSILMGLRKSNNRAERKRERETYRTEKEIDRER